MNSPSSPEAEFIASLPFKPDPFQLDAIRALAKGRSVLVSAPTGTGKTVVAEYAVDQALSRGLRAMYTTPIKALSNQKFRDFRARYGNAVGLLTGDLTENPEGRLLVMTTEVVRNMLVQDPGLLRDVGVLVFDEVHYLADPERGTAWEESILLTPAHVPLVCLSATVDNAAEIADWLRSTGREVDLIQSFHRVVPLKHRYFFNGSLYPMLEKGHPLPVLPAEEKARARQRQQAARSTRRPFRDRRNEDASREMLPPEVVKALAADKLLPAIYFLFSRKSVEEAAESCQRLQLLSPDEAREIRQTLRDRMAGLDREDAALPSMERLLRLLPRGIGFHHAGLLPPMKTLVEELLARGILKVVFATDTLALGINVPARSVVLGAMVKFDGQSRRLLSPGEYRQLTGRAGRRGMDPVGYAVLLYSPWVGIDRTIDVATGDVAPLESAFRPGYSTVLNLWQSPEDEDRLAQLIAGSLRQFQEGGKLRAMAAEREEIARELAALPTGCPLDGGPINWLEREKDLKREADRAEAAMESARRERAGLEDRVSAWPWRYTKSQKKEWLRGADPGSLAYSRGFGWGVFLGPASDGIGHFLFGRQLVTLSGYSDLDYLPDPPIEVDLSEGLARRAATIDGILADTPAAPASGDGSSENHGPETGLPLGGELLRVAEHLESMPLPDVEAEAREEQAAARSSLGPALAAAEERLGTAEERMSRAAQALLESPCRTCPIRAEHRAWERQKRGYAGELVALERDLESARKTARRRAERVLRSLRGVLESLGYLSAGRPTAKSKVLMRLFDSNGLIISEVLDWGVLGDATAEEVAEFVSWFAYDREGSGRALPMTERLSRIRTATEAAAKKVLEMERRQGVDLSTALSPDFRGVGLAWAAGAKLADLSARAGIAEGDIVFALQKSLDLCRQLRQAAGYSRTPSLVQRAAEAEKLIRRGVVDSYYRWVVGDQDGIAGAEKGEEAEGLAEPTPRRRQTSRASGKRPQ